VSPLRSLGASALLLLRVLRACLREGVPRHECLLQLTALGARSVWLVMSGMAFFGGVMVAIANSQARRFIGNLTVIGPAYFELLIREFGPITSAVLCAARLGASAAAELSTMSVSEQVEALEMSAGDPLSDLVGPRLVASVISVPALCILGTFAASASAALTASWAYGVDGRAFLDARYVDAADILCGGAKVVLCGLYIPLAACSKGLAARGGVAAVGAATTDGVVSACVGCMVIDFAVALAFNLVGA
jgi:phospholipid/cholesterol/gamma-HCH transport system permease protein